jgi:fumarate hydratase class II
VRQTVAKLQVDVLAQAGVERVYGVPGDNKFATLPAHDGMVSVCADLRTFAGAMMKIGNDVRWYACGARGGCGDIKTNPTPPSCLRSDRQPDVISSGIGVLLWRCCSPD